jgi:RNA polymerase sigma-70 factor (ECF subfamily)
MFILALQESNPAALSALFDYAPALERHLERRFRGYIAAEDLTDIVRDALVRAFVNGHKFDPQRAKISTWLNRMAHYEALTYLRRQHPGLPLDELADGLAAQIEPGPSATFAAPSPDIAAAIQQLPPDQAQMIRMYYYEDLSFQEIAAMFHVREGTVRSALSRARTRLRAVLRTQRS